MHNFGSNKLDVSPSKFMDAVGIPKQKVLVWSDSVLATTGFGRVSHYILDALYKTGLYEIDQLAINYFGEFFDRKQVPYVIVPARLRDATDPYGNQMFINSIQRKDYDIVLVINDTFVVEDVAKAIPKILDVKQQRKQKLFKLIYYYPVDCRLLPQMSSMIQHADRAVAYTHFGKKSSEAVGVTPSDVIYHGTDVHTFKPINSQERRNCRRQYLGVQDDETFVFVSVNRNSLRKDIARTLLAYKAFRKKVPNSLLYVHAKITDGTGGTPVDLRICLDELGLDPTRDVIFPANYDAAKGFPAKVLNQLYNCGDAFITTNLGEGWGLTITESMAAGVPVVAPNHTSAPEILGNDRGYLIPCKEQVYIDNSGYRPLAHMDDIVKQMMTAYRDWTAERTGKWPKRRFEKRKQIIQNAHEFTQTYSWENVSREWVKLFDEVVRQEKSLAKPEGEVL